MEEDKKTEAPKVEAKAEAPKAEAPKAETKAEAPKADTKAKGSDVKVPAKFKSIVEGVEKLTVVELNELVKIFEEKFDVSAAALTMAAPSGDAGGDDGGSSTVSVELANAGEQKIQVIKAVKELLGLGLKEAKDLVDAAPSILKEGIPSAEADEVKKKIEEAGGSVNIK